MFPPTAVPPSRSRSSGRSREKRRRCRLRLRSARVTMMKPTCTAQCQLMRSAYWQRRQP